MAETKRKFEFEGSDALVQWYRDLENNKADRAALRRCASLQEVYETAAFWYLYKQMHVAGVHAGEEQLALVAAILSHVKSTSPSSAMSLPQAMAYKKNGSDKPVVSPMRFERMLQHADRGDLFRPLLGLIRIVDTSQLSIEAIASGLWFWGPSKRKEWAKEYFTKVF